MVNLTSIFSWIIILVFSCLFGGAQPIAFPGAEGFGKYTTGGRGGKVYIVSNLNDAGAGSFREAAEAKHPRYIVFSVSGTIHLKSEVNISKNATIAGQTAPGDGICFADYSVKLAGDNIIVQYLRFRLGDRYQDKGFVHGSGHDDAFGGGRHKHIILDHCSMSWSTDEILSMYGGDSSTIQWSILSEPLNYSYHFEKGDTDYEHHGYGAIWGGRHLSAYYNVFAHCISRTPRFQGIRYGEDQDFVDFRNNVIYNWEHNNIYGGEGGQYNIVNNYFKYGPATRNNVMSRILNPYKSEDTAIGAGKFYVAGNYVDGDKAVTQNNVLGVHYAKEIKEAEQKQVLVNKPYSSWENEGWDAEQAFTKVLESAGAMLPKRDTLDHRILNDVWNRTGNIIDVQGGHPHGTAYGLTQKAWPVLNSATAPKDSDKDGMPDAWEMKHGLDPMDPKDAIKKDEASGYDFIELYLHELAQQPVVPKALAKQTNLSKVWVADNGDGTYKNPILHADYSDPDAVRVGDDYYMTSSSFNAAPGLPLLHSKDLVNWTLVGHAFNRQHPEEHFRQVRHGEGVWAPSLRHHKGEFYLYYPDPDFGIYLTKAKTITGPWSEPILVEGGKGLIDPSPLWDADGKAYLVYAYAGSRAGVKSIICVKPLLPDGTKTFGQQVMVYDGQVDDETIEGPKFYKRNGWYYIFAPAGGVTHGWQVVLRSKNVYGPYERKIVMHQGGTVINGPHQGAWVDTKTGEDWFLHFQDKDAYGRIVHLQPMRWVNDWPVIGIDKKGTGTGEPVLVHKKPNVGATYPKATPPDSDSFNEPALGLQWQWQANPQGTWAFPTAKGNIRLFSVHRADSTANLWHLPNLLFQKWPAEEFGTTVKLTFLPKWEGEKIGLMMFGMDYAYIGLRKKGEHIVVTYNTCKAADRNGKEVEEVIATLVASDFYLRAEVTKGGICQFSFSTNGTRFTETGKPFKASKGRWTGAKVGLFCTRNNVTNNAGYADVDWFNIDPVSWAK